MAFYTGKNDTNLNKDFMLNQPDIYISKFEYEGSGVYAENSGAFDSLTPATSPSWTINDYASTVGLNLEVVDDNGKLAYGKISANAADSITFDAESLVLDEDGTSSPTFTDGSTYNFRILTASSSYKYGDFFGYVSELSVSMEQETAEYKQGIPRKKIVEDLLENMSTISGSVSSFQGEDILKAVFGMNEFGSQTSQFELGFGSGTFNSSGYRIALVGKDRVGRETVWLVHRGQFKSTGEVNFSDEGYKTIPFELSVFSDNLRESCEADMIRVIRSDTETSTC